MINYILILLNLFSLLQTYCNTFHHFLFTLFFLFSFLQRFFLLELKHYMHMVTLKKLVDWLGDLQRKCWTIPLTFLLSQQVLHHQKVCFSLFYHNMNVLLASACSNFFFFFLYYRGYLFSFTTLFG